MTPVNGPGDVAVGDLVRDVCAHYESAPLRVAKAGPEAMTLITADGKKSTRKYVTQATVGDRWSRTNPLRKVQIPSFARLDAHERWRAARPATPDVERVTISVRYAERRPDGVYARDEIGRGALDAAIRDRPEDVIAQIRELSAWLKSEPSKDAP